MPLESTIQANTIKWLNTLPQCRAVVYTAHIRGAKGHPDIYGVIRGRSFFFEMKQPGEEPTALQHAEMRKWRKAGALVGEATSVAEVKALMRPLLVELGLQSYA